MSDASDRMLLEARVTRLKRELHELIEGDSKELERTAEPALTTALKETREMSSLLLQQLDQLLTAMEKQP